MPKITAAEMANFLDGLADGYEIDMQGKSDYHSEWIKKLRYSASILRRVASGELAEVVHAHWKEVEPGHDILFECSNCGRIISTSWGSCEDEDTQGNNGCDPTEEWLCCPTCGTLMDGKDDSHAQSNT